MYRACVDLRFAICCKTRLPPVSELAGDAESGFKALDFHAKYSYLPFENERSRLARDDNPAFQVLSRRKWFTCYAIEAAATNVIGFSFERKLSSNPPELEMIGKAESCPPSTFLFLIHRTIRFSLCDQDGFRRIERCATRVNEVFHAVHFGGRI